MTEPTGKPPRKADQLLQALSKKYEDKARDREARSTGRSTPGRTPRGSRERLFGSKDSGDNEDETGSLTLRSARGSTSVRSELFSPGRRRSPSVDSNKSSRLTENRSPAVRSSNVFERKSPGRRVSPVQSPGLFEKARKSPSPSPMGRDSPSYTPNRRMSPVPQTDDDNAIRDGSNKGSADYTPRSSIYGSLKEQGVVLSEGEGEIDFDSTPPDATSSKIQGADSQSEKHSEEDDKANAGVLGTDRKQPDHSGEATPRSAGRIFGRLRDRSIEQKTNERMYNPDRLLDKSFESSNTLQDDAASRRSSMSNYSRSNSISHTLDGRSPRSLAGALEKEQTDSQLRKLELENSSLRTELKSWKDKFNRSQAQIVHLETKLKNTEDEFHKLRNERKKEISKTRQLNQRAEDNLQETARGQKDELHRKIEMLKLENDSLEKELSASRRMTETAMNSNDLTKITNAYKSESSALREEIKRIKLVLKTTENSLEDEVESKNRLNETNRKLTEMNDILKQQLDMDSGGTVADKQVKGIESRLKITEDRLFQERSDRADKLSEIEDKLLNDNSQLQIEVKDLARQLNREREKLRVTDVKLQDLKDQQLSLNFLNQSNSRRTPRSGMSTTDSKKFTPEVSKIVDSIHKENGITLTQESDIITYLYNKEQAVMKQLNDWKNELQQLKDLHRSQRAESDSRKLLEELHDSQAKSEEAQAVLQSEISQLVKDKHDSIGQLKNTQDRLEAAEAELEYLRVQLKVSGGSTGEYNSGHDHHNSERVLRLENEIRTLKSKVNQLLRSLDIKDGEITSIQTQLDSKTQSLDEAILEIESQRRHKSSNELDSEQKQKKIDQLNIELKSLTSELSSIKDKNSLLSQSKLQLENQIESLNVELDQATDRLTNSTRQFDASKTQKSQLELDLNEKDEEIKTLKSRYVNLELKLTESRENLIHSNDNESALQRQVEALQQQLLDKSHEHQNIISRLQSQESSYTTTESRLLRAQKEIEDLKTEVSVEKLNFTKLKSESDREAATHRHESGKFNREIKALSETVESLRQVKSDLSKDIEVSKVKMAELTARLSEAQTDIIAHREKEKTLSEERDRLTEEKHEAKLGAAKLEAEHKQEVQELNRVIQDLKHDTTDLKAAMESTQSNMDFEHKKVASELENAKKQLDKRDKELRLLSDTLTDVKHDTEQRNSRIKELETEIDNSNYHNKQAIDELNETIRDKSIKIESYEQSLKDFDSESRTKKELEVRVRQLETDLEQKNSVVHKLREEQTTLAEHQIKAKETIDRLTRDNEKLESDKLSEMKSLNENVERTQEQLRTSRDNNDRERTTLQDKLHQVNSDLKAAEATISVMNETKQTQQNTIHNLERRNESLKSQLQESQVNEKLAVQKSTSMKEQLDDSRYRLVKSEERLAEREAEIVKLESDVKIEREKYHYLKNDKDQAEATKNSLEMKNDMCVRDIDMVKSENSALKDELESLREIAESRTKKQTQQVKSQIDSYEKEKARLQSTNLELSNNLTRVREQTTLRAEEVQKYKQQLLINEQQLKESNIKLNRAEQRLINHDDAHDKLQKRNLDLELELNELKNLVSRLEESTQALHAAESSKIDNLTRAELNKTMTDWGTRLQSLLENGRSDRTSSSDESRMKVIELEGRLKHEQLMHQVTKNQLKSVEEENTRLRKRLLTTPKRRDNSGKSRAELIQEKIMESEMRVAAQMGLNSTLLSTANFGTTRINSTYRPTSTYKSNFNGMSLLGSLGFTSPRAADTHHNTLNNALNNTFSLNSLEQDDSQSEI